MLISYIITYVLMYYVVGEFRNIDTVWEYLMVLILTIPLAPLVNFILVFIFGLLFSSKEK